MANGIRHTEILIQAKCSHEILFVSFSIHYTFCFHLIKGENKVFCVMDQDRFQYTLPPTPNSRG